MSLQFRVLHQDEDLVAIDKPAGFHVHPPEDQSHRISRSTNCLALLRDQLGCYLYPVHRLDRATSGVLLFALRPESARELGIAFAERRVSKTYYAVTRGWTLERGRIDHPLVSESDGGARLESRTDFDLLAKAELPIPNSRHGTSRYSLVRAEPLSGRRHQIRKHFAHIAHPLIGDTVYGDGVQNRIFRKLLDDTGLLLKAQSIEFSHPRTGEPLRIESRWNHLWHQVFDLFGVCPYSRPQRS